jgi:hypothetical protein
MGSCEYGDEPSGSGATDLVISLIEIRILTAYLGDTVHHA